MIGAIVLTKLYTFREVKALVGGEERTLRGLIWDFPRFGNAGTARSTREPCRWIPFLGIVKVPTSFLCNTIVIHTIRKMEWYSALLILAEMN